MSREATVMQRSIKVEVQSPVKPEVLKPSNTQNIRSTGKASSVTNKTVNSTLGKITSTPVSKVTHSLGSSKTPGGRVNQKLHTTSPKSSVTTTSSSLVGKSPLKPLLPIRPSPTTKVSLSATRLTPRSPSSLNTLIRTPSGGSLSASVTSPSLASTSSISPVKCRRRISYSESDVPVPVSRRNARERNRVKQVSQGFALLRQHVPQAARKKKMSKVETLRCAVDYIRGLQLLLDSDPAPQIPGPTPVSAVHSFHNHHHHHHHHHQQLQQQQTQVFLQPPHAIEPHILKLPVADETFQSPVSLRYDSVTGTFFRTSPSDSEGSHSPAQSFLDKHHSPVSATPSPALGVGVVKTENNEGRSYGREEQDLLEALAWWQHNIQQ